MPGPSITARRRGQWTGQWRGKRLPIIHNLPGVLDWPSLRYDDRFKDTGHYAREWAEHFSPEKNPDQLVIVQNTRVSEDGGRSCTGYHSVWSFSGLHLYPEGGVRLSLDKRLVK